MTGRRTTRSGSAPTAGGRVTEVIPVPDGEDATMECPGCGDEHDEWEDEGTTPAGPDSPAMVDLWGCERCGYTVEGVRL